MTLCDAGVAMRPWVWFLLCLVSRLALPTTTLEGWDGVNFAESLSGFDLDAQAPHFPGYPIYVLLAQAACFLVQDECLALVLPSAILGSLVVVPLHGIALRLAGPWAASLAASLYTLAPLTWLAATRPAPDAGAVLFPVWAVLLLLREERAASFWGGVLVGLGFGVRPSNLPVAALVLLPILCRGGPEGRAALVRAVLGTLAGLMVWSVPYVLDQGAARLWSLGGFAVQGHLLDWGGSVLTRPGAATRGAAFLEGVWASGLGGWWPGHSAWRWFPSLGFLAAAVLAVRSRGARTTAALLLLTVPYGAWVLLGQNLEHARHFLPILPFAILWISLGLAWIASRWRTGRFLVLLALLPLGADSFGLALTHHRDRPAQVQLVEHVAREVDPMSVWVFAGQTARLFEHHAPDLRVRRARTAEDMRREVAAALRVPRRILVTSEVIRVGAGFRLLAVFEHDPRVFDPPYRLLLYEWEPTPRSPSGARSRRPAGCRTCRGRLSGGCRFRGSGRGR